ncbi:MAG: hypothetical protein ACLS27_08790, partial [Eubacterium sp.]
MRKAIAVVLATTIAVSVAMIGCSKSKNNEETTTKTVDGLKNNEDTFSIEEETVTDKNGEAVTDKNGNPVTTQVMYKETTDKKGNKIAVKIDDNGEVVTDKNKKPVTVHTTKAKITINTQTTAVLPTQEPTITTVAPDKDIVPKIDDSTKSASFTEDEIKVIEAMFEVPGIYASNYENSYGVPLDAAKHAAVWMAQR